MTKVKFFIKDNLITGFEVSGHANFDEWGKDIVCSAVSSAVGLTHLTLENVLKINVLTQVDEKSAKISVKLPSDITDDQLGKAQTALNALKMHFLSLTEDYPENIKVLEV